MSRTLYTVSICFISVLLFTKVPRINKDSWRICRGILFPGINLQDWKTEKSHRSLPMAEGDRNSQKPVSRTTHKQKLLYRDNGILLSLNEQYSSLCSNTDEAWRHEGKWTNPYAWGQIVYDPNNSKDSHQIQRESVCRIEVSRDWKEGKYL